MADKIIKTIFQFKRGLTEKWESVNPILRQGEPGIEFTVDNKTKMKIGDGVTPWNSLAYFSGEGGSGTGTILLGDNKSIVIDGDTIKVAGFDTAEVGQVPQKNADGTITWYTPITPETFTQLSEQVNNIDTVVQAHTSLLSSLTERLDNVYTIPEVDEQFSALSERVSKAYVYCGSKATFAELPTEGNKVGDVWDVQTADPEHNIKAGDNLAWNGTGWDNLGGLVDTSNLATKVELAETKTLLNRVVASYMQMGYEVAYKPVGTLVDYREKEIRIMCPADTEWSLQNVGENGDSSKYYVGLKIYAPSDDIVSFKEDIAETISDETMYYFVDNEFAGIDANGRKYSIIWLPVAAYNSDTDTWKYYGESTIAGKYIGWFYCVEWYNEEGKVVASDKIRINLANEESFSYIGTYIGDLIATETVAGSVKSTNADNGITVKADGTMEVNNISIMKLTQNDDEFIVFDCGGADSAN